MTKITIQTLHKTFQYETTRVSLRGFVLQGLFNDPYNEH
jgi:hypothetical protein